MNKTKHTLFASCFIAVYALASAEQTADVRIDSLASLIANPRANIRCELFFKDRFKEQLTPSNPESLQSAYAVKIVLGDSESKKIVSELTRLLKQAKLHEIEGAGDFRVGIIISGGWDTRFHEFYFDASGEMLRWNGRDYTFDDSLKRWQNEKLWPMLNKIDEAVGSKDSKG
jgi:hypothetical protein